MALRLDGSIDSVAAGVAAMDGASPLVHALDSSSHAAAIVAEAEVRRSKESRERAT